MCTTVRSPMRHIIFFGETGSGKSSVINLLLGADSARVSNGSRPCTQASAPYETPLYYGRKYCFWDTRGLGEGRNIFQAILGWGSEKDLKKLLKERHHNREIDLLVYCVRGPKATEALVKTYENFCAISRRLAAPVAIVVTGLEKEENMDDWWRKNVSALHRLKLDFDDHACITTLPGPHLGESKEKLLGLITRDYSWEPKESGSYFGSPVPISTQSAPSHPERWIVWNHLKSSFRSNIHGGSLYLSQENDSGVSPTSDSVYYSANSAVDLIDLSIPDLIVERRENFATHSGCFGDVWECDMLSGGSRYKVAVKAVKTKPEEIEYHLKKLRRELRIWCRLNHRNVVPLLGVVSGFGYLPSMVSPWFSNGSLHKYLADHRMLHPSKRRCLLRDIAAGLNYLHSQDIIHGDLHSGNVLIDDDGIACLTDFGLSFVDDFVRTSYLKSSICGNVVFADPALVNRVSDSGDIIYPTKPCDVYSFGGLVLHVLSGKIPYANIRRTSIHKTVMSGKRPQISNDITHQDKLLIRSCWDRNEHKRPSAGWLLTMFV